MADRTTAVVGHMFGVVLTAVTKQRFSLVNLVAVGIALSAWDRYGLAPFVLVVVLGAVAALALEALSERWN